MDNHSKEVRSFNMSKIKSKDTKPEEIVRKFLFSKGFRYRKNLTSLPGKPDIVLTKYKTIVFVNGCFWHKHEDCSRFIWPSSNIKYWKEKITRNVNRDFENYSKLEDMGWKVLIVWECELKKQCRQETLNRLYNDILTGSR